MDCEEMHFIRRKTIQQVMQKSNSKTKNEFAFSIFIFNFGSILKCVGNEKLIIIFLTTMYAKKKSQRTQH